MQGQGGGLITNYGCKLRSHVFRGAGCPHNQPVQLIQRLLEEWGGQRRRNPHTASCKQQFAVLLMVSLWLFFAGRQRHAPRSQQLSSRRGAPDQGTLGEQVKAKRPLKWGLRYFFPPRHRVPAALEFFHHGEALLDVQAAKLLGSGRTGSVRSAGERADFKAGKKKKKKADFLPYLLFFPSVSPEGG